MGKAREVNRDRERERDGQRVRKRWIYEQNNREGLRMRKIVRAKEINMREKERGRQREGRTKCLKND